MESLNNNPYSEAIEKYGMYVGTTEGTSMMPMIRSGVDTVVLKKPKGKIKKYDCVLYYRKSSGKYVLHRVIKVKDENLVICGDNQWQKEYGIKEEDIIAVLDGFYKKEKYITIDKFSYKLYYHFRVFFRPFRMIKSKVRSFLSKIKHKIFK